MNTRYTIDKLTGDNYLVWSTQVQLVLESKGLWGHVTGDQKLAADASEDVRQKYQQQQRQAMAEIILNVDSRYVVSVLQMKNPKDVWNTLLEINRSQATATQTTLRRKLLRIKKAENQTMQQFANAIVTIENDLAASGYMLPKFDMEFALLEGLPETYDTIRTILRERSDNEDTDLTFGQKVTKLEVREEELRQQGKTSDRRQEVNPKAFMSEGSKNRNKNVTCYCCKKKGHVKRDCFYNPDSPNHKPHLMKPKRGAINGQGSNYGSFANEEQAHIAFLTNDSNNNNSRKDMRYKWFLDSCASQHMCNDLSSFTSMSQNEHASGKAAVETAKRDGKMFSKGHGTVQLECEHEGNRKTVLLKDVAYVPDLRTNLISVPKLQKNGLRVTFPPNSTEVIVSKGSCTLMVGTTMDHNIAELSGVTTVTGSVDGELRHAYISTASGVNSRTPNLKLLHKRLSHVNCETISKMIKHDVVDGLDEIKSQNVVYEICDECRSGKATAAPHKPVQQSRSQHVGDLIHVDLVGPITPTSLGGAVYILTVLDDASAASWVAFLKMKSYCANALQKVIMTVRNQTKRTVLSVRSDRGGEFINDYLAGFFTEHGITHEFTAPYSPESNGKAERLNRTLVERARSLLAELKEINGTAHKHLWAEAIHTANYVRNRVLNKGTATHYGYKTPYQILFGRKPNIATVRIFGTKVHVLRPPPLKGNKFDSKTVKGIHVGYSSGNAYRIFLPESNNIIISRDVTFAEELIIDDSGTDIDSSPTLTPEHHAATESGLETDQVRPHSSSGNELQSSEEQLSPDENDEDNDDGHPPSRQVEGVTSALRRSQRPKPGKPVRFRDNSMLALFTAMSQNDPTDVVIPDNHTDAMDSPWRSQWVEAMSDEMNSIEHMKVYTLTDLPEGRKPIGCKWVFDVKRDVNGHIMRYKARLVAKGFSQIRGVDFQEIFSPVTRFETLRLFMGIAAHRDFEVHHVDIKTAFLCSDLEEEIYLCPPWLPPELRNLFGAHKWSNKVWKLLKALYGLKQGSRAWNRTLRKLLKRLGFVLSKADPSLYVRLNGAETAFILVYVDDLLIAAHQLDTIKGLKDTLSEEFQIRDLGDVTIFLGIQVYRDRPTRSMFLSQENYIRTVLERFGMTECKVNTVPIRPETRQLIMDAEVKNCDSRVTIDVPYRELVGSVMFLATTTRPDISYAVSYLARYMHRYTNMHWMAAKSILRYLAGTTSVGIHLKGGVKIEGYTDSDWAGDIPTRKSTSGYVFKVGEGPFSWKVKLQSVVAASSVEAEYIAQAQAIREALWIRAIATELGMLDVSKPLPIYGDNTGAIALVKDEIITPRSKHIDVVYHIARDYVEKGLVTVDYVPSMEMVADGLTKPLGPVKHKTFMWLLGVGTMSDK